jgi:response regulator RpfG family c-di-GMP phosphodiesterase
MTHTVLIVQGDELARVSSQMVLEAAGFCVELADNGHEGFRKANELRPDLIFFDVVSAQAGEWDAVALLKRDTNTSKIPVIVVSIVGESPVEEELGAIGVSDFLKVPFDPDQLIGLVEKHIAQKI